MKHSLLSLMIASISCVALAVADDAPPAQPTQQANASADTQAALDLEQAEQQAGIELAIAKIKLELVRAKKDLRAGQTDSAVQRARLVLGLANSLPPEIDMDDYTLPAEGILARAGVEAPKVDATKTKRGDSCRTLDTATLEAELERRQAGRPLDSYGTTDSANVDEWIAANDDFDQVPAGEIRYPRDWSQKVARRAQNDGGEVARSGSWIDPDGREWYTAVYDIHDLTYVPPDFQPSFSLDPIEDLRVSLDRHALRWGYGVFNGFYSSNLDTLFPLFRTFGGLDDYAWRGPKYSRERQQQVVQMIQSFTIEQPPTQPQIISLDP